MFDGALRARALRRWSFGGGRLELPRLESCMTEQSDDPLHEAALHSEQVFDGALLKVWREVLSNIESSGENDIG